MRSARCWVFDCDSCRHFAKGRCPGCEVGNQLLIDEGREPCAIYACAVAKQVESCHVCDLPVCPFPQDLEIVCPIRAQFEKKRCYAKKLAEYYASRRADGRGAPREERVSDKTIGRLRWYLCALEDFVHQGVTRVSSQDIGRKVGVKPGLVRRDLNHFGEFGRPSIGYDTAFLRGQLEEILHLDNSKRVVWVGSSRLAGDASLVQRFADRNCQVVAVFDTDSAWAGKTIAGLKVNPLSALSDKVQALGVDAAVIAVPAEEAQAVADKLVMLGVTALLNLTSAVLVTPPDAVVRNVDVVAELFALSYYCGEKQERAALKMA